MKTNNIITVIGSRDVSSTGNVERFYFQVTSFQKLSDKAVEEIVNIHGMGGQEFSFTHEEKDRNNIYTGNSVRYSD